MDTSELDSGSGQDRGLRVGENNGLLTLVGATTAVFVANLYYAQPLVARVASDLHIKDALAGSIVSASQFGYGLGLFLLGPVNSI
jgi:predicted MFS family arabinose efflux permease